MVTGISVVIGALKTIPKSLIRELEELEIGGRAETLQTTHGQLLSFPLLKLPSQS